MTHPKTRILIWTFSLIALAALQGCGFHLRGTTEDGTAIVLPSSISPLYIHGLGKYDPLHNELQQLLSDAKVTITTNRAGASTILQIIKQNQNRRVLSVDQRGKVVEYEIHHAISFNLIDGGGAQIIEEQSIGTQRAYVNPDTEVLGKNQEEELLRDDMRRSLARSILSRMQKQLKK